MIQKQARHALRNPMCRAVQRLLGLTNFASIALPLTRLQLQPLQWWLKQHYKGPLDMFKTMPITEEARHNLEWWCSFKSRPKSIHRPSVQEVVMTDALTKGFGGECLSRQMAREQGQRHTHKSPRTRNRLEGVQQVRVRDKGESNLVSDRQLDSGSLPNERRRNEMSAAGSASLKDPPKVSQGWGDPDPRIPEGHCKPSSRCPLEESEGPGMEPVCLSMGQVVQDDGTTSGRSVCEQLNVQS